VAIFKYTLPSGAKYTVQAPDGYTQLQADRAFYEQVASGSLVGYKNGQTLSSAATRLANFGLSRLQRGTAGVDITTVLAIVFDSPIVAPVPNLTNIPLTNPVTASEILNTGPIDAFVPIGPLGPEAVRALIAQIGAIVDQEPDTVTTDGVGKYQLSPNALEKAGYVKPGTSNYPNVVCALQSPSVWTGKDGITELGLLLDDPQKQAKIQNEVMVDSYDNLTAAGLIQETPTPQAPLSSAQVYTSSGQLNTVTAATLLAGTAAITGSLSLAVKNVVGTGNAIINGAVQTYISQPIQNITSLASGAVNTVTQSINNLSTQAKAVAQGIINTAVAPVNTVIQTVAGVGSTLTAAGTTLTNLSSTISNFDVTKIASGLTTTIGGDVGGLVTNASKFGTQITSAWATGTSGLTGAVGDAASAVTGTLGEASSVITGVATEAGTLVTSTLGEATTLVSGAIGEVTGAATAVLGDATSYIPGSLVTLSESAGATLSQLGGSLDIFAKMSQFSIGDALGLLSSDSLVSSVVPAPGFSNTVNRDTVDAAVSRILGNPKIPDPIFEYPSASVSLAKLDISQAKAIIKSLTSQIVV
jgi:hypothetical protein